ncbi:MAG: hypothetical protein RID62_10700 [Roseovarius sp.]|jgi:hypothetical protein|uniref:hypothetical protein n=2 Tax=Roseovarius sp. TaxID=1486281 RepID=UPI0032EBC1D0
MLRLGPPYYSFEGVTVMGDAQDKLQYYYFPNSPHVPVDDQGRPAMRFVAMKEAQDEVDEGEEDLGGFFFFDTVLSWPEATLKKVKKEIEDSIEEDTGEEVEIRLGPLPFGRGGVQLNFLDETTREIVLDPPDPDPDNPAPDDAEPQTKTIPAWVPFLRTSGTPSLYGENRAIFTAELNRKATKLLMGAFDGLIPASVFYTLEFVGQMEAYNVKVTADWEQVYDFVQNRFEGNFIFFNTEIDKIVSELEEKKIIKIEAALDTTETDIDADTLEAQFNDVRKDLQEMVLDTFFEPTTNPNAVTPDGQSSFDSTVDSLVRMRSLAHGFPSVGYTRREVDITELRSIEVDYSVRRAVTRRIYPQGHIHAFFEDLGVTKDDIVTVVDGADDVWSKAEFSASCVADFEGSGIDQISLDVQYVKDVDFTANPEEEDEDEDNSNALWSFNFKTGEEVFRKGTWFDPEIGPKFFYRYRIFFKPDAIPGPSNMMETQWRRIESKNIIVNAAELFERQTINVQTVDNFPWDRYPQVLLRVRYNDPVSKWLHEDAKLLSADDHDYAASFRQRAKDGIEPEYSLQYIRSDNEVIETAWEPVDRGLTVIRNPDPEKLELTFVVSPATVLGLLILDLRYEDPENGVFESTTLMFQGEDAYKPQIWAIPWKDVTKRRFLMGQTIIDANSNIIQTGMIEAEGNVHVLGDVFAKSMEVQPKLIGPDFASQGVSKIVLTLKYEDAANGVLKETLHEFSAPGDAPTWKVMLKDASRREYSYELTYVMDTGFTKTTGEQTSRDRFLMLSSAVPS